MFREDDICDCAKCGNYATASQRVRKVDPDGSINVGRSR